MIRMVHCYTTCRDVTFGATGAGNRQAAPSGPSKPIDSTVALASGTPGQPRSRSEEGPLGAFGLQASAIGASGSGQTLRRRGAPARTRADSRPGPPHGVSADTGPEPAHVRAGVGGCRRASPDEVPLQGAVPHAWGGFPCQRAVQRIDVGDDGAAVPENPRGSNGKSRPTGGAGRQLLVQSPFHRDGAQDGAVGAAPKRGP